MCVLYYMKQIDHMYVILEETKWSYVCYITWNKMIMCVLYYRNQNDHMCVLYYLKRIDYMCVILQETKWSHDPIETRSDGADES